MTPPQGRRGIEAPWMANTPTDLARPRAATRARQVGGPQLSTRFACGLSKEKAGISTSNERPSSSTIR